MFRITLIKHTDDGLKSHTVFRKTEKEAICVAFHWRDALKTAQDVEFTQQTLFPEVYTLRTKDNKLEILVVEVEE